MIVVDASYEEANTPVSGPRRIDPSRRVKLQYNLCFDSTIRLKSLPTVNNNVQVAADQGASVRLKAKRPEFTP
jgi:hypothetical protein